MSIKCQICNRELADNGWLGRHLKSAHSITSEEYILKYKYNSVHPICSCGCGCKTKFAKQGVFDFHQFLHGHKTPEAREKIFQKIKETNLNRYGVESVLSLVSVQQKVKNTNLEKYGVENSMQRSQTKEKAKQTMLLNYGVANAMQSEEVQKKIKQTMIERYGVENPQQNEGIKNRTHQTNLKKYGVMYPFQNVDVRNKHRQTMMDRYGVPTAGESQKFSFDEILEICKNKQYEPLFSSGDYSGQKDILNFRCAKHNVIFSSCMCNVRQDFHQCPNCASCGFSIAEKEVVDYIKSLGVENIVTNSRQIIPPQELDIYIPDKQLAIEYHGLYWHSELNKDKNYHLNKFLACQEKGIKLIQIFEDDWRDKKEICKSMLRLCLGLVDLKTDARKLELREDIDKAALNTFLEANHLQGNSRYIKSFGLYLGEELIECITLRKPFTKKGNCLEIARLCTKCGIIVRGGFSRLLKASTTYCKDANYDRLITYSDCLYSSGNVYKNNGFEFVKHSKGNYYYTNFESRFNRFKFRATKELSEHLVAEQNGVYKIYGAGNYLWEMKL